MLLVSVQFIIAIGGFLNIALKLGIYLIRQKSQAKLIRLAFSLALFMGNWEGSRKG